MVHLSCKRCPEAVDTPAPGRKFAVEGAIRAHLIGQHKHVAGSGAGLNIRRRSVETLEVVAVRKPCLFLYMLQAPDRM